MKGFVLVALAAAVGPALRAQTSTSAALLQLPASTRALALGDAFVAAGADESAIFYNPAQLAVIPHVAAGLSVQPWFVSSTLAAAAAATRMLGGDVGVGLQVLDYGSSERTIGGDPGGGIDPPTYGTVSAGDYVASLAYAISVHGLRLGATGKYVSQRLVNESSGTAAVDFGAAFDIEAITVGASVQNIGGTIALGGDRLPLPRSFHVGAAVPVHHVGPIDLLGTFEVSNVRGGKTEPSGGLEVAYTVADDVTVLGRVGALARPDGADISPVSFGGGLRAHHLAVDYAYEGSDILGATHRLGVRWWR